MKTTITNKRTSYRLTDKDGNVWCQSDSLSSLTKLYISRRTIETAAQLRIVKVVTFTTEVVEPAILEVD